MFSTAAKCSNARKRLLTRTGAMTGEAGFEATQIGKINVNEFSTYVAVERSIADLALQRLSQGRIKGKGVKVRALG